MKKSSVIVDLEERIKQLEAEKEKKKEKKEDICEECGGDLEYVEEGIVYCPHCEQYYEYVADGEE